MPAPIIIEIDATELNAMINRLKKALTPGRVNQVMYGIFQRTEGHVRQILKEDIPPQYYFKPGEIAKATGHAKLTGGGIGGVGCVIPVTGPKKSIGGGFGASGGAHGWASLHRKYRIKARIVKAGASTLPPRMSSYGGQPPFRNLGSRLGGVTFTRAGGGRFPIMKVVGISVAQAPMNRSKAAVQGDIQSYLEKRMAHELSRLIGG